MTQTGYFAPPSAARRAPWRIALTTLAALLGPPAAGFFAFGASITWTGCFIECNAETDHPNHLVGGLLFALALGLLVSGPVLAGWLLRSGTAVALTLAVPVLLALCFVIT